MFIVWIEDPNGVITAEIKKTKLAAVRAYNKLAYFPSRVYGWSIAKDAEPRVRVAVGLKPFLALGETDA